MRSIRIGAGAGFAGDRIEPALELLREGALDYICFECLAERTIAMAQQRLAVDPDQGYDTKLAKRMETFLPEAWKQKVKIISNMGAANVPAAVRKTQEIAKRLGLVGLKIVGIEGDNVFDKLGRYADSELMETGKRLSTLNNIVAANAYIGCEAIVSALKMGADVILTGRSSDPALFMAPVVYEFGWEMDDYDKLGKAVAVGHLLECSNQVSGGNYAYAEYREVDRLWDIGFPFADVFEDGNAVISKLEGTGGLISVNTCTEQIIYEVHDPARYITPDCIADFSNIKFEEISENTVGVSGATGRAKTDTLKVSVGYEEGFVGGAGLSYGGPKCFERAALSAEIIEKIIQKHYAAYVDEYKIDIIGYNSLFPRDLSLGYQEGYQPMEVRVRVAVKAKDPETISAISDEVDSLTIGGPANGGGLTREVKPMVSVLSLLIPREEIDISFIEKEVS